MVAFGASRSFLFKNGFWAVAAAVCFPQDEIAAFIMRYSRWTTGLTHRPRFPKLAEHAFGIYAGEVSEPSGCIGLFLWIDHWALDSQPVLFPYLFGKLSHVKAEDFSQLVQVEVFAFSYLANSHVSE